MAVTIEITQKNNIELFKLIIPLWYAQKKWAEELLIQAFCLKTADEILKKEHKGRKNIPGTAFNYRTHGIGVDVYKTPDCGGIDFDFNKNHPDAWRLKIFFYKQYNDGALSFETFRHLSEDDDLLEITIKETLPLIKIIKSTT